MIFLISLMLRILNPCVMFFPDFMVKESAVVTVYYSAMVDWYKKSATCSEHDTHQIVNVCLSTVASCLIFAH